MRHETTKHYSQEAALFEGFLDPYMKYSSGYYENWDESLDTGITRMLNMLLEAGRVKNGARVLEIGNGWGSFVRVLSEQREDIQYVGVNPSQVQLDWICDNVSSQGDMVLGAFEEVMNELSGQFDAIYMIGAMCHMRDKLAVLKRLNTLLADDGRLVIEDTFFLSEALYQAHAKRQETKFVQDEVFGYAHVHSLARHFDELRRAGFHMMSSFDNSDHYARTIEIWTDRLKEMDPEEFPLAVQFIQYMDVFQRGWNHTICNHMMTVEKLPNRRRQQEAFPGA